MNPPKDSENFSEVKAFNNSIGIQIKWSCSTTINDRMYLFGGLPDDGTESTLTFKHTPKN